jgi:hypothetical protein
MAAFAWPWRKLRAIARPVAKLSGPSIRAVPPVER